MRLEELVRQPIERNIKRRNPLDERAASRHVGANRRLAFALVVGILGGPLGILVHLHRAPMRRDVDVAIRCKLRRAQPKAEEPVDGSQPCLLYTSPSPRDS